MSELKVIKIELNNHGKPIASIQGTTSYYGISPNDTFYPQADADKVIAEKDKEIQRLENLCESYRIDCDNLAIREANAYKEIERDNKQLRRNKYKRCLAMADKCVDLCHKAKDLYHWAEDENLEHHYNHKIEFFARWHNRWLEIAKQFKESK